MRSPHPSAAPVAMLVSFGFSSVLAGGTLLFIIGPHESYFADFVTSLVTVLLGSLILTGLLSFVLAYDLWRNRPWRNER